MIARSPPLGLGLFIRSTAPASTILHEVAADGADERFIVGHCAPYSQTSEVSEDL